MRRAARTDDNHSEIVKAFRLFGWSVLDIHQIPNCADLVVSKHRQTLLIEIKDGSKPPSKRQLTQGEKDFADKWNGLYCIVESVEDVRRLNKEMLYTGEPSSVRTCA